jgi:hypothetical protein
MTFSGPGIFARAFAQSDDLTTPTLTISAYFAHWSYGLVGISGQVQDPYPGDNSLHLEVYNPNNELVLDNDISLNIYQSSDNRTSASFGNIYFTVERQYVYDSYTIVATYADQKTTEVMPPFSSEFQQPPDISIESLQEGDDGSVGISGHVWGAMAQEQLDFSIHSPDGTLLTTVTTELGLHAQFVATVNAKDASLIFTENGDYTIVGNLVGTDAPQAEATLTYVVQDYTTRSFLEVVTVDTNDDELEVMFSVFQNGELVDGGVSPESVLLYDGQEYFIDLLGLNEYVFDHWEDTGSTTKDRTVSISEDAQMVAVYRNINEPPPEPEPAPEEQPPQDDGTTEPSSDDEESSDNDEESDPENVPTGTLISPFIFKNETTAAPPAGTKGAEQPQENVDVLDINGTLASFHFLNGMQLYILSGNWSMAMNDTAVIDFGANFTMVRADGHDRQTYSLGNLTAVNDSDLLLGSDTLALTSALDYHHANGTITRVNATITLEKLSVVKIELDSMGTPVYGVVDKVMRTENGETLVMARQFDMI